MKLLYFKGLAFLFCIIICSSSVKSQLAGGTYTIGSGGNYANFTAAVSAMSSGISGPVIFNVKKGTYNEKVTINSISGASLTNTITFQSDTSADSSNVILTSATTPATLNLNGANYIIFKKITIQTTGSTNAIKFTGGSNYISFLNCQLIGKQITGQDQTYANSVVYSTSYSIPDNNLQFSNNLIKWGSRGIDIETSPSHLDLGTKIYNNRFLDQSTYGLYLGYHVAPEIIGNIITTSINAGHWNVYLNYCINQVKFNYNKLYFTAGYGWGLKMVECNTTSNAPNQVYNNFIYSMNTSNSGGNGVGFELYFSQYTQVYHNNFLNLQSVPATNIKGCMFINGADYSYSNPSHYDIQNNNFINIGTEYTISVYPLGCIDVIKNNNYYSDGTKFGRIVSTEYTTYNSFMQALGESNSYNVDPQYKSTNLSNLDLHITNQILKGTGANLTSIVYDDIDHIARPHHPTIGANELGDIITAPTATITQSNMTVCENTSVTFTLDIQGTAPFSYQWKMNGNNISNATKSSYTLNPVTLGNAGTYTCYIQNLYGSNLSNEVILNVNGIPVINKQTGNQSRCINDTVSFKVNVTGSPTLAYQWKSNDQNISGATFSKYSIGKINAGNAGNYSCVVTNSCKTVTSIPAILTVNSIPVISYITPPQEKCSRDGVLFNVISDGNSLSYQWLKGSNIIPGATKSSFAIGTIVYTDTAMYKCMVSNVCGTTAAITSLSVNIPPVVTNTIGNTSVCQGSSVKFTIEAKGNNVSYQWTIGSVNILGATNTSYSLTKLKESDGNVYSCVASSFCGSSKLQPFLLTVITPPQINLSPITQTKNVGDSVSYSLSPGGAGPFSYQWRKGNDNIIGATNYEYKIKPLSIDNSGLYSCIVTNSCGGTTVEAGTLIVICSGCASTISGTVKYDNKAQTGIANTTVYLETTEGIKLDSTVTDGSGDYIFTKVANGSYKLICGKTKTKWAGCNPVDALLINRYVAKLYKFGDNLQSKAADVDNSSFVNSVDALLINKRYAKILSAFIISDWIFESPVVTVNNNSPIQDIKVICAGDVNSSYPY